MKEKIEGYPEYNSTGSYGFFGYEGTLIDSALGRDDPKGLRQMFDYGWLDLNTETLDQLSMIEVAEKKRATKCAAMLKSIGFKAAA